ncbi:hypothetical protein HMPREF9057_01492, partial [Actinomyces sp. oral taxon 171 str. F0337]
SAGLTRRLSPPSTGRAGSADVGEPARPIPTHPFTTFEENNHV